MVNIKGIKPTKKSYVAGDWIDDFCKNFDAYKAKVTAKTKVKTATEALTIDMKLYPLPPKKKRGEVKEIREFKMSDFKFPAVKRVNTRLARKTLQTDLGADILEDIGGLKI